MREHDAFMRTLDPAIAAAAEWHTRREDGLDATDEAQFQQWLAADPAHLNAYRQLDQGFTVLRSLGDEQAAQRRAQSLPESVASADAPTDIPATTRPRTNRRPARSRLAWLMPSPAALVLGCLLLLSAGIGWHLWHEPSFTQHYATQAGQRITTTLPDGSELVLDVKTRAEVALYRDRREVRLDEGQMMFTVSPNPAKPFRVLAGPASITVVGTRFSVRYDTTGSKAGTVEVAVEEGRVAVDGTTSLATRIGTMLGAGQAVQVTANGIVGEVAAVPVSSVAPWRKGQLRFSDTPLSRAIEEMERYGPTGLVVTDPKVADLRLGGSFEIARPDTLAQVLPRILPVKLRPRDDGKREVVGTR
ncbi:FecR family protein [Pigmentiphaga aceris]|nr:FecR domain-containing protein [Pigmentiphaga aceris]